jgi:hypothetical protein
MFFAWDITIPKNTLETDPLIQTLKLSKGVITRLDIRFPAGCHGLVKVRLFRYEAPLIPLSRGEWVTGNDETIPTEAYYELVEAPAELKFVGCSPGAAYDHVITVRIQILPRSIASMIPLIELLTKVVTRLFGA